MVLISRCSRKSLTALSTKCPASTVWFTISLLNHRRPSSGSETMIFDLFHSVGDPVVNGRRLGAAGCVREFLEQAKLAEALGFDTVWLAESHFSSETQKRTS